MTQQLFLSGDFSTRVEGGAQARNLITDAAAKYYWRWHPDWLLYVSLSGTVTYMLDPDMQLLLGETTVFAATRCATNRAPHGGYSPSSSASSRTGIRFGWRGWVLPSLRMWAAPGAAAASVTAIPGC